MPDKTPCLECTGLAGAGPTLEPHPALVPMTPDSGAKPSFKCQTCGCRWQLGPLGWSRLVD